jgi:hypothetical protein
MKPSMLVGSIRRILHDANVHRLSNSYPNRFSCVVIDEAGRTFEEDIARVLEDIELAKRLQRVAAAALHLDWELIARSRLRQRWMRHLATAPSAAKSR